MIKQAIQTPEENPRLDIKKEIEYLHRQFPWKTYEQIAAVFFPGGEPDREALRRLTATRILSLDEE